MFNETIFIFYIGGLYLDHFYVRLENYNLAIVLIKYWLRILCKFGIGLGYDMHMILCQPRRESLDEALPTQGENSN